jgi:hypothetical protein
VQVGDISRESIAPTFRWMALRKLDRQLGGVVPKPRSAHGRRLFWLFAVAIWWAGIFNVDLRHSRPSGGNGSELSLSLSLGTGVVLASLTVLLVLYFVLRIADVIHWALYWLYVVFFLMLYAVLSDKRKPVSSASELAEQLKRESYRWGIALLLALELLTVASWLFYHKVLPFALARASDGWIIRAFALSEATEAADAGAGAHFTYTLPWWRLRAMRRLSCRQRPHHFFYTGSLRDGKPHGYGEWRDDASDGECLRGFWNDGRPVAPFHSRLFKSGFAFTSLHVGYVTARSESVGHVSCLPRRHAHAGLRFGVSAVECSVSGEFLARYPRQEILWETDSAQLETSLLRARAHNAAQAASCLSLLRHADELLPVDSVTVTLRPEGVLAVSGFEPKTAADSTRCFVQVLDGAPPVVRRLLSGHGSAAGLQRSSSAPAPSPPLPERLVRLLDWAHPAGGADPAGGGGGGGGGQLGSSLEGIDEAIGAEAQHGLSQLMPPPFTQQSPFEPGPPAERGATGAQPPSCRLHVRGWRRLGLRPDGFEGGEVLLYIHGFNMSTADGLERIAQFLALGRLPPHIKPLVFSWPTATVSTYAHATAAAQSAELGRDLRACLQAMGECGVHSVHVLCHSMGAQCFLYALRELEPELQPAIPPRPAPSEAVAPRSTPLDVGARSAPQPARAAELGGSDSAQGGSGEGAGGSSREGAGGSSSSESSKLRLSTVTMINPEVDERFFLEQCLPRLRALCAHISVYGDEDDTALFWSQGASLRRGAGGRQHGRSTARWRADCRLLIGALTAGCRRAVHRREKMGRDYSRGQASASARLPAAGRPSALPLRPLCSAQQEPRARQAARRSLPVSAAGAREAGRRCVPGGGARASRARTHSRAVQPPCAACAQCRWLDPQRDWHFEARAGDCARTRRR